MGEEWGETRPFAFFTDFHGELADAVREGRRREFRHFAAFARRRAARAHPRPERPGDLRGLEARLGRARDAPKAGDGSASSRDLLATRRREIVPRLAARRRRRGRCSPPGTG